MAEKRRRGNAEKGGWGEREKERSGDVGEVERRLRAVRSVTLIFIVSDGPVSDVPVSESPPSPHLPVPGLPVAPDWLAFSYERVDTLIGIFRLHQFVQVDVLYFRQRGIH